MAGIYHAVDDANIHVEDYVNHDHHDDDADISSDRLSDDDFFAGDDAVMPNDESIPSYLQDPIVIGYAFGKKKMATMGVVMAEASKAKVTTTLALPPMETLATDPRLSCTPTEMADNLDGDDQQTTPWIPQHDEGQPKGERLMRTEALNNHATATRPPLSGEGKGDDDPHPAPAQKGESSTQLTVDALNSMEPNQPTRTVFSLGYGNDSTSLKHIVRYFQSSCSSAASATETTVSTKTWISNGNLTTGSKQQQQQHAQHSTSTSAAAYHYPVRLSFVPLDPNYSLEDQQGGKFDLILHKLTEDILSCSLNEKNDNGNEKNGSGGDESLSSSYSSSFRRVSRLKQYQQHHPESCMVDDPSNVQTLMSRSDIGHVLERCLRDVKSASGIPVGSPRFVECTPNEEETAIVSSIPTSERDMKVAQSLMGQLHDSQMTTFPLIAKPLIAAGTKQSHSMAVLLSPEALIPFLEGKRQRQQHVPDDLKPITSPSHRDFVLQEYVNHDAVLYKVYVLGDIVKVYQRPSLPNLPKVNVQSLNDTKSPLSDVSIGRQGTFLEFDSQRPYPRLQDFGILESRMNVAHSSKSPSPAISTPTTPTTRIKQSSSSTTPTSATSGNAVVTEYEVRPIVDALKRAFGLELFGFDILVTNDHIDDSGDEEVGKHNDHRIVDSTKASLRQDRECNQGRRMLVVDVNYFPSYKEVTSFPSLLAHYLTQRVLQSREEASWKKQQAQEQP